MHVKITPENGSSDDLPRYLTLSARDRITVGRASTTSGKTLEPKTDNMYLKSPIISRNHAELFTTWDEKFGSSLFIKDMASSHGTYVNKVKLSANSPHKLVSGDSLRFGINISRDMGKASGNAISTELTLTENFDPPRYKISISRDEPVPAVAKATFDMTPGRSFSVPVDLDDDDSDEQSVASDDSLDGSEEHAYESASDPEDYDDEDDEEEDEHECEDCEDDSVNGAYDDFEDYLSPELPAVYQTMGSLVDRIEETAQDFSADLGPFEQELGWTWAPADGAVDIGVVVEDQAKTVASRAAKVANIQREAQEASIKSAGETLNKTIQQVQERLEFPVRRNHGGPIRIISSCSKAEAPMLLSPIADAKDLKIVPAQAQLPPCDEASDRADKPAEPEVSSKTTEAASRPSGSVKRKHDQIVAEPVDALVETVGKRPVKKARSHYRTAATAAAAGALLGSIGTLSLLASLPAGFFD